MNTAINLISANQRLIESRAVRLEWIVKPNSSSPTNQFKSEAVNAPAVQRMSPENSALMEKGRDLLKSGDVGSARLVFNRLANAGIADAALALAATYDPRHLAQRNLIGVAGDEDKAHHWYQRASGAFNLGRDRTASRFTRLRSGFPDGVPAPPNQRAIVTAGASRDGNAHH